MVWVLAVLLMAASPLVARDSSRLRVIAFGAHPLGAPSFDLTLDPAGPLPF